MATKTFDPNNVQVILNGVPLTGYADGTFVDVEWDEDRYSKTVGADGEVSRARLNNRCATVTLTLLQTSAFNDVLSGFMALDDASNDGIFPILIKEIGSGRTVLFAQEAWITKPANVTYSKEIEEREWTIDTAQFTGLIGGNS